VGAVIGAALAAGVVYAGVQAKQKRDGAAVIDLYNYIVEVGACCLGLLPDVILCTTKIFQQNCMQPGAVASHNIIAVQIGVWVRGVAAIRRCCLGQGLKPLKQQVLCSNTAFRRRLFVL
jgi:hypothetical protein